jgi:hypothetical protein
LKNSRGHSPRTYTSDNEGYNANKEIKPRQRLSQNASASAPNGIDVPRPLLHLLGGKTSEMRKATLLPKTTLMLFPRDT